MTGEPFQPSRLAIVLAAVVPYLRAVYGFAVVGLFGAIAVAAVASMLAVLAVLAVPVVLLASPIAPGFLGIHLGMRWPSMRRPGQPNMRMQPRGRPNTESGVA
jgi:hypothetical protein